MPYLPSNNSFWSWIRRIRKAEEGEGRHVDRHGVRGKGKKREEGDDGRRRFRGKRQTDARTQKHRATNLVKEDCAVSRSQGRRMR